MVVKKNCIKTNKKKYKRNRIVTYTFRKVAVKLFIILVNNAISESETKEKMQEEYESITEEQRKNFIDFNRSVIYKIPKSYDALREMIEPVRGDLLDLMRYISKLEIFRYKGRYTFVLPNNILAANVRKKTTQATTNRHYAYLCALGLLRVETGLTQVNKNFLDKGGSRRPIKQMSMPKYTFDQMAKSNIRAEQLKAAGVTAGNISHDKLYLNGLQFISAEIYPVNDISTAERRRKEWNILCGVIDDLIEDNGYTTKADIYADERFQADEKEIDILFRIYRKQLTERYRYTRPTKAEKECYNLCNDKFILTVK